MGADCPSSPIPIRQIFVYPSLFREFRNQWSRLVSSNDKMLTDRSAAAVVVVMVLVEATMISEEMVVVAAAEAAVVMTVMALEAVVLTLMVATVTIQEAVVVLLQMVMTKKYCWERGPDIPLLRSDWVAKRNYARQACLKRTDDWL
jgi:hypothetical protein